MGKRYKQSDAFPEANSTLGKACDEYEAAKDGVEDAKKRLEHRMQAVIVAMRTVNKFSVKHQGKIFSVKTTEAKTRITIREQGK